MLGPLTMNPTLRSRGLTLVELIIVIAVAAVLITIAAPSLRDFIVVQRLKGVNAQLVTDVQFARSEAVARNLTTRMEFFTGAGSHCYTIFTARPNQAACDCTQPPGAVCTGDRVEIRTVRLPAEDSVRLSLPPGQGSGFTIDPNNANLLSLWIDDALVPAQAFVVNAQIDTSRVLRNEIGPSGRVSSCAPGGVVSGTPSC